MTPSDPNEPGSKSAIERYAGDQLSRAESWATLPAPELKRRASKAAAERDAVELWALVEAYLFLHGSKGARASHHTLRTYKRGVLDLLAAWHGENLLRPGRDSGVLYLRRLEAGVAPDGNRGKAPSPATLQVKLAAARTLYKALRWSQATEARPFEDVSAGKDPTPAWEKRRPYRDSEVEELLELAEPAERVMVLLGAHAGLRIGEMSDLRWSDLDLERGTLRVRSGKGGKAADVSVTRRLAEALRALASIPEGSNRQRPHECVLPWGADHARRRFRRLCSRAGVKYQGAAVHGLRHSAGTRYYQQTNDLGRVAAHLRHADIQTTRIYAKIDTEAISDDIEEW